MGTAPPLSTGRLAWVLFFMSVACSSSHPPQREALQRLADVTCESETLACGDLIAFVSGGTCEDAMRTWRRDGSGAVLARSMDEGRVILDSGALEECLDLERRTTCDGLNWNTEPACRRAFRGVGQTGDPCSSPFECAPELSCDLSLSCPGQCVPSPDAGQPCSASVPHCGPDLFCNRDSICSPRIGPGEPCPYAEDESCQPGAFCRGAGLDPGALGVCAAYNLSPTEALGQPCDTNYGPLCEPGLVCEEQSWDMVRDEGTYRCVRPPGALAPCRFALPSECPDGEYCDGDLGESGACVAGGLALGDACMDGSVFFGAMPCATGMTCIDGHCAALGEIGAACTSYEDCLSGECQDGTCQVPLCSAARWPSD